MDNGNKEIIERIAEKYGLELVLLFGSRVSGRIHKESDFDVAYLSRRDLDLEEESNLIVDMAPLFKNENIDLVNLKKAPPLLFYGIFNDCKTIFAKDPLIFYYLRAYAFKKYIETKPLYDEKLRKFKIEVEKLRQGV